MPTVDNLDIQISAQVTRANASLTTLINRLDRLSASLMGVNSRGMATMGAGVNKLTNSMQNFSNATKTADFSRLARNLSSIGSIDGERVKAAASGIQSFAGALGALNKIPVSDSSLKIAELAKGISQLGYKSSTQAIDNIPKLATAMSQLMRELFKAPMVSRNLIDMTNALANLARTGASSGRAAKSLGNSLDRYTLSTTRATKGTFSLASALGKLYATYWLLFRAFGKIGDAINIASDLYEVQNVVDVTFGNMASKVEEFAQTSIKQFGMSELTLKQVASQFQAMGSAMSIDKGSISNAQKYLNAQTKGYVELSDSMADVSLTLTKLTADMASFYNVEQSAVAEDLQSIFTGQTKPLRQYGVDLTEVNLKQWAMTQGLNSNIDAMTQAEKTMLRYQYVLAHTGAAQNDFQRTASSWANSVRILRQQFEQLGVVVGKTFIAALKPLVKALNAAMSHIIAFAQTVSNALGKIFGWKFEVGGGGVTEDLEYGSDYAEDLAGGMSDAADSAKKLKSYLLGIDELNVIEPQTETSAGAGGAGGAGGGSAVGGEWVEGESILKEFESEIDTLYELGEYIRDALIGMMESIDWKSVYEKARAFGKGLAEFLNGLLAYDGEGRTLFGTVAKTFANTLNAIVYAALEFAKEFDFYQFGVNLADGINQFFKNFDFKALAQSLNEWVDGFKEAILGFLETVSWDDIISGITDFISEIELDTLTFLVGAFTWMHGGKALTKKLFEDLIVKHLGLSSVSVTAFVTVATSITFVGGLIKEAMEERFDTSDWNFGEWIYNTLKTSVEGYQGNINSILMNMFYSMQEAGEGTIGELLYEKFGKYFEEIDFTETFTPAITAIKALFSELALISEPFRAAKEQMQENIENIILIVYGLNEKAQVILEELKQIFFNNLSDLWTTYITPWFTEEQWQTLFSNIRIAFETKWNEIVEWWNGTAIVGWWNTNVTPWFSLERWQTLLTNIKTAFTNIWNQTVVKWVSDITSWWTTNVQPWFTISKWAMLLASIPNAFSTAFQQAKDWVSEKVQAMYDFVAGIIDTIISKIQGIGTAISTAVSSLTSLGSMGIGINLLGSIPGLADGGYVPTSYSMFVAGENGVPEILGTVGGRTAVAGGAEITGIREEIRNTGEVEASLLQTAVELLNVIASKDHNTYLDGRELISGLNERNSRNGYSFT